MSKNVTFKIERVDTLGQGLSFQDEGKITFIPKTLPEEEGVAKLLARKGKKIQFAESVALESSSPKRITPLCEHYQQCSGCSYLHTDYETEKELKRDSYSHLFKKYYPKENITFTSAPRRLQYRNRIQLHYDRHKALLGFKTRDRILPVPHCQIPHPLLQKKLNELYEGQAWLKLTTNLPPTGHLEILLDPRGKDKDKDKDKSENHPAPISLCFNERYAHKGFNQVFQEMNEELIHSMKNHYERICDKLPENSSLLELFGGTGNLTQKINFPAFIVDYYTSAPPSSPSSLGQKKPRIFITENLYEKKALAKLLSKIRPHKSPKTSLSWLILDPPRSGFKNLHEFVTEFNPQFISYLSCNPSTQIRDIAPLLKEESKEGCKEGWEIEDIQFFDLFPSTHHLESLIHLRQKNTLS